MADGVKPPNKQMSRASVPSPPKNCETHEGNAVLDAVVAGKRRRWRYVDGKRSKLIAYIEYAYDPLAEPGRKDWPWARTWFRQNKDHPRP